jgi:hypothetical protein
MKKLYALFGLSLALMLGSAVAYGHDVCGPDPGVDPVTGCPAWEGFQMFDEMTDEELIAYESCWCPELFDDQGNLIDPYGGHYPFNCLAGEDGTVYGGGYIYPSDSIEFVRGDSYYQTVANVEKGKVYSFPIDRVEALRYSVWVLTRTNNVQYEVVISSLPGDFLWFEDDPVLTDSEEIWGDCRETGGRNRILINPPYTAGCKTQMLDYSDDTYADLFGDNWAGLYVNVRVIGDGAKWCDGDCAFRTANIINP